MGKLRKNHVKRIYKKTYDKSPSVAKILKTVLTTSFKYALCYGYVEEDYVSGLKMEQSHKENLSKKRTEESADKFRKGNICKRLQQMIRWII